MNSDFRGLYQGFFHDFKLAEPLVGRCSAPILLSPPSNWFSAKTKLLLVGQETLGWGVAQGHRGEPAISRLSEFLAAPDGVGRLMSNYEEFAYGKNYHGNQSPFWRAFRLLQSGSGVVQSWTNIFRFDVDAGSVMGSCSAEEVKTILAAQHGLLRLEIDQLAPDVVLFLSGPNYDSALRNEYPEIEFNSVAGRTERQFARVRALGLPARSYRLYHPSYLNRSRERWAWLQELVDADFDLPNV